MEYTNENTVLDSLRQQSLAAAQAAVDAQPPHLHAVGPPKAGETYFFKETADHGIQWLLIDEQPDPEGQLAALPLDVYPLVGSRDVALYPGDPLRIANVRCDLEARLESSRFVPQARNGVVPADDLAEVRAKRVEIASSLLVPVFRDQIVDGDPEYWGWRQTVRQAITQLEETTRKSITEATARPDGEPEAEDTSSSVIARRGKVQGEEMGREIAALRAALAEHQRLAGRLAAERAAQAQEIAELQARLAMPLYAQGDLLGPHSPETMAVKGNLALTLAASGDLATTLASSLEGTAMVALSYRPSEAVTRGAIRLGSQQKTLALLLQTFTGTLYHHYRIEVTRTATKEIVLTTAELAWSGNHLGVVLSISELEDGDYSIQLFGAGEGEDEITQLQERYELTLERW